ncbi:mapk-regulated corepressor-interacting protein 1 isoform X1 [Ictalurus furcatus]|nr:mapk-regulated corepressor-interacting protein 1 isoform X1 [Ictalurus furcatus]
MTRTGRPSKFSPRADHLMQKEVSKLPKVSSQDLLMLKRTDRLASLQEGRKNHQYTEETDLSSSTPRMHTYKRTSSPRSPTNTGELYTPAHEENVRFIHDTWLCVLRDVKSPHNSERGPQEYVEKNPNPNLLSFTPVDLSELRRPSTQDCKKS